MPCSLTTAPSNVPAVPDVPQRVRHGRGSNGPSNRSSGVESTSSMRVSRVRASNERTHVARAYPALEDPNITPARRAKRAATREPTSLYVVGSLVVYSTAVDLIHNSEARLHCAIHETQIRQ